MWGYTMKNRQTIFEHGNTYRLAYTDDKCRRLIKQFRFLNINPSGSLEIEIGDDTKTISGITALADNYAYELEQVG
jgi:hypothetical protein